MRSQVRESAVKGGGVFWPTSGGQEENGKRGGCVIWGSWPLNQAVSRMLEVDYCSHINQGLVCVLRFSPRK